MYIRNQCASTNIRNNKFERFSIFKILHYFSIKLNKFFINEEYIKDNEFNYNFYQKFYFIIPGWKANSISISKILYRVFAIFQSFQLPRLYIPVTYFPPFHRKILIDIRFQYPVTIQWLCEHTRCRANITKTRFPIYILMHKPVCCSLVSSMIIIIIIIIIICTSNAYRPMLHEIFRDPFHYVYVYWEGGREGGIIFLENPCDSERRSTRREVRFETTMRIIRED